MTSKIPVTHYGQKLTKIKQKFPRESHHQFFLMTSKLMEAEVSDSLQLMFRVKYHHYEIEWIFC